MSDDINDLFNWGIEHGMKADSFDVPDEHDNPQGLTMHELQRRIQSNKNSEVYHYDPECGEDHRHHGAYWYGMTSE